MKNLKEILNKIPAEKRTTAVKAAVGGVVIVVALASYYLSGKHEKVVVKKEEEVVMSLGEDLLEDDIRAVMDRNLEAQKEQNEATNKAMTDLAGQVSAITDVLSSVQGFQDQLVEKQSRLEQNKTAVDTETDKTLDTVENGIGFPPPIPVKTVAQTEQTPSVVGTQPLENTDPILIGDIGHVEGVAYEDAPDGKKKRGFYLAPGFMEAMLLTGLKAKTVEGAQDNPEPMVLRIQKPAVLPNHVKADLKGCFVIANGFGSLASERVESRLVSLHCLSHDNQAVIDQRVKGFVVDSDGTNGLKGIPVTKMGANMARVFMAGVFGGIGEAVSTSSTVTSISPQGTVSTLPDGEDVMAAGLGQGISDAAADIRRVYLDLVRQSAPVIEIGPTKQVTIMITEGVNLEIHDPDDFNAQEVARGIQKTAQR